jgi:hypothetical protein
MNLRRGNAGDRTKDDAGAHVEALDRLGDAVAGDATGDKRLALVDPLGVRILAQPPIRTERPSQNSSIAGGMCSHGATICCS